MAGDTAALRVKISGRVQGVAYRAWTQGEAERLGVAGWVRNEPDGSVVALIAGPPDKVSEMIDAFWRGPHLANVANVEAEPAQFDGEHWRFRIRY